MNATSSTYRRANRMLAALSLALILLGIAWLVPVLARGSPIKSPAQPERISDRPNAGETCFATLDTVTVYSSTDASAVQQAIDAAAPGATVKLAGYCPGVQIRAGFTQTAYISQPLILRGGYTTTNWADSDPQANPTVLDAQGQGRVLYITGDISPTIENLHITGGNATGLGGAYSSGYSAGGGVYIVTATTTISNCLVSGNTISQTFASGGGI